MVFNKAYGALPPSRPTRKAIMATSSSPLSAGPTNSTDPDNSAVGRLSDGPAEPSAPRARWSAQDLALVATFTALIAVLGMPGSLYLFGSAVPITLQTLGVALAGAVLGWKRGAAAVLLLLLLCLIGLPVMSGFRGGPSVFAGPSIGYLVAWPIAAAVIGYLVQWRLPRPSLAWVLVACVAGSVIIHALGIPGMMLRLNLDLAAAIKADALFLPGDAIKTVTAAVIATAVHRANPGLTPGLRRR